MKRRVFMAAFMLLSVAALAFSNQQTVCAFSFCDRCVSQCWNDSWHVYYQCRNTKSVGECLEEQEQFYANCKTIFCPGCSDLPKPPPDN